jgi:hypothetical protein
MRHALSFMGMVWVLGLSAAVQAAHLPTCVEYADEHGPFSIFQAQRLCQGSMTLAPADCGILAAKYLNTEQAISLCTYATSNEPVACAAAAKNLTMMPNQIFYLCNQAQNVAPADCAYSALQMNVFSGDEIALLCFGSVDMTSSACASNSYYTNHSPILAVQQCRAIQPQTQPGFGGLPPVNPAPLPLPFPTGPFGPGPVGPGPVVPGNPQPNPSPLPPLPGGGTGMFTSCILTTAVGSYQGLGFTAAQAQASAQDQCLQVESVLACNAGRSSCH